MPARSNLRPGQGVEDAVLATDGLPLSAVRISAWLELEERMDDYWRSWTRPPRGALTADGRLLTSNAAATSRR